MAGKAPKKTLKGKSTTKQNAKNKLNPVGPMVGVVVPVPPAGTFSVLLSDPFGNPFWKPIPNIEKYWKSDATNGLIFTAL